MNAYDVSPLPVLRGGDCVGSLSESVLVSRVIEAPGVLDSPAVEDMDALFSAVEKQVPMAALGPMLTRQTPAVLVRHDGGISGFVTRYDVVRYLAQ